MATLKLAYVDRFRDSRGVWRYYFRRTRRSARIPLPGRPGEAEFMAAYQAAYATTGDLKPLRALAPPAGTMDALAAAYYRSAAFLTLSKSTQKTYRGIIERLRKARGSNGQAHGLKRVAHLERRHINELVADKLKSGGPWAANNLLKVLRVMLAFAVANDWRRDDPTAGVKTIRAKTEGFKTWSETDIAAFEKTHASGTRERLALALLLYTGQRRGDVVRMGRQHISGDTIRVVQSKTGASLAIPMHAKLRAEIGSSAATDNLTFILTAWGRPFSAAGFGNWFRDTCNDAGLTELSAHGLRKAAARRLAEAGCSALQIQAITGHKTLAEVSRYTAAADQERMAREAMKRMGDD